MSSRLFNVNFSFFKIIFLFVIIAFVLNGETVINFFIGNTARLALFVALFFCLLIKNCLAKCFNLKLFFLFFIYISWCVLTSAWSSHSSLTIFKSISLGVISLTFSSASYEWVRLFGWRKGLNWLYPVLIIALLSGIFGWLQPSSTYSIKDISRYSGLSVNSNVLGFFCACTFPLIIWQCRKKNIFWLALAALNFYYLLSSFSRASFLILAFIVIFYIFSLTLKKKFILISLSLIIFIFSITLAEPVLQTYLYKNTSHTNIFNSRQDVWAMSYDAALQGGMIGVGYAESLKPTGIITKWRYTENRREKGSSQLGSVEETGLIGLALHMMFLMVFLVPTFKFWKNRVGEQKILFGLILGAIMGVLVHSIFESWWSGPFSQQNVYFWLLFGVARGCMAYMDKGNVSAAL